MYNYAKIEVIVEENNLNESINNSITILSTIKYNKDIIINLMENDLLNYKDESLNLCYSISMTTRKPRPLEKDGVDYFFVDVDTFKDKIEKGELLEHAQFVGNFYGTPQFYVDQLLSEGKNVVLEIEVQGALQVMEKRPDALTIFIVPPSLDELERRIRGRSTEEDSIVLKRLEKAKNELETKDKYKHIIVNDTINEAVLKISEIIKENV
jgi:guanylate kinase